MAIEGGDTAWVMISAALVFIMTPAVAFFYGGMLLRRKLGFDDALDVFGVHGVGGTWGAMATGLFATSSINPVVTNNGLLYGGGLTFLGAQIVAVAAVWAFAFAVTFVIMNVLKRVMSIRMSKVEERIGADIIQHGESAYS